MSKYPSSFELNNFEENIKNKYGISNTEANGNLADKIVYDETDLLVMGANDRIPREECGDYLKFIYENGNILIEIDDLEFSNCIDELYNDDANYASALKGDNAEDYISESQDRTDHKQEIILQKCDLILSELATNHIALIDESIIRQRLAQYE